MPELAASVTNGQLSAAISNEIVKLFVEYVGRGPTRARTTVREEIVVCLLEDTLTKAEKTLAANGQADVIRALRRSFQETMRPELVAKVEQLTGRKVIGFMSDNSIDPDYAAEIFVMRPAPGAGNGAAAAA